MFNLLLFSVFWCLVEVNSQTAPYVSFMGQTLANHSYVDLSLVGDGSSDSNTLQCHTDLSTCCGPGQGVHRGDWYSPGSTDRLPFSNEAGDIYEQREAQRVDLRRSNSATSPVGIYRCEIPTNDVHDDDDISVRATVYVGLYTASGGMIQHTFIIQLIPKYNNIGDVSISGGVALTVNSDFNGASPQFTLTCISTGGPATTVTWTRDSTTVTEGNETVLNDPVTAQYTHTLTVTGKRGGLYNCTVMNNKPSTSSKNFTVRG